MYDVINATTSSPISCSDPEKRYIAQMAYLSYMEEGNEFALMVYRKLVEELPIE